MKHKFLRLFKDGVWTGNADRSIRVDGHVHDLDEYAKEHGIELPTVPNAPTKPNKPEKQVNIDVEETHEDMEPTHDSGDTEVDGDGNSEG